VAVGHQPLCVGKVEVFEDVLAVDQLDRARTDGETKSKVMQDVGPGPSLDVELEPAIEVVRPASEVELRAGWQRSKSPLGQLPARRSRARCQLAAGAPKDTGCEPAHAGLL
jgi:hypothetical protein